jgi:hypothetical protein
MVINPWASEYRLIRLPYSETAECKGATSACQGKGLHVLSHDGDRGATYRQRVRFGGWNASIRVPAGERLDMRKLPCWFTSPKTVAIVI